MPVTVRGHADPITTAIAEALRRYVDTRPAAEVDVYRYSPVSVRVRVVDPDFRGKSRSERHRTVWPLVYQLDEDSLAELTLLLLLTPEERGHSPADREFETGNFARDYSDALNAIQGNGTATP
ncbi:MAG: hypothetical protein K2P78_13035 [Gemmataceae bacterium]|nr:hypothetical protein [Gemmataceae bacterium]